MKVRKCSTPEEIKKRKKAVIFCLSADKKCIVVEEGKEILVGDVGDTITDPFKHFVGMLPEKDCRYALYDASFETKESRKEELMFFLWWALSILSLCIPELLENRGDQNGTRDVGVWARTVHVLGIPRPSGQLVLKPLVFFVRVFPSFYQMFLLVNQSPILLYWTHILHVGIWSVYFFEAADTVPSLL